ncbi:MAG TPA: N-acetyltransferase [Paracoccus sp. (in: a-proteobacteria)]|nr:N-acetyltransferase [Paracoccus sp. (in: a-proteobacteria)]
MAGPGVTIRDEGPSDAGAIRSLVAAAFRDAPHASGTEAQIVDRLRAAGALTLSLVAESQGAILGHAAASPVAVGGASGWCAIGPLAVLPGHQSRGIGSALRRATLGRLRAQGAAGAVLVDDPGFYGRFGFAADPGIGVPGIPAEYVLVLPFGASPAQGPVRHHPAFGLDEG